MLAPPFATESGGVAIGVASASASASAWASVSVLGDEPPGVRRPERKVKPLPCEPLCGPPGAARLTAGAVNTSAVGVAPRLGAGAAVTFEAAAGRSLGAESALVTPALAACGVGSRPPRKDWRTGVPWC